MSPDDDGRTQGMAFGDLPEELESIDYPASVETVRDTFGDHEVDLENGSTTLGELLAPLDDETFDSSEGVLETAKNLVGDEAVGREGYSDRGSGGTEQDERADQSF